MSKEEKSRFEDLFTAARPPKQEPEARDKPPQKRSKSKDPNYVRTTVYLPKELHRQLKAAAAAEDQEMSEVVTRLIQDWLQSRES